MYNVTRLYNERVNRYTVIFRNKLTVWIIYGNMTLEENVYLQGLRIQRLQQEGGRIKRLWPVLAGSCSRDFMLVWARVKSN